MDLPLLWGVGASERSPQFFIHENARRVVLFDLPCRYCGLSQLANRYPQFIAVEVRVARRPRNEVPFVILSRVEYRLWQEVWGRPVDRLLNRYYVSTAVTLVLVVPLLAFEEVFHLYGRGVGDAQDVIRQAARWTNGQRRFVV